MAANSYCSNCGEKGRTIDGLCHDCYDDVTSGYRDWISVEDDVEFLNNDL